MKRILALILFAMIAINSFALEKNDIENALNKNMAYLTDVDIIGKDIIFTPSNPTANRKVLIIDQVYNSLLSLNIDLSGYRIVINLVGAAYWDDIKELDKRWHWFPGTYKTLYNCFL